MEQVRIIALLNEPQEHTEVCKLNAIGIFQSYLSWLSRLYRPANTTPPTKNFTVKTPANLLLENAGGAPGTMRGDLVGKIVPCADWKKNWLAKNAK